MNIRKLALTAAMAAITVMPGMLVHFVSPGLVPFSILPVFIFLAGIILGANYGALAMIVYVVLGLFGLPVFSAAPYGGFGYVLKPTFGFLLGYIAAAYVTGLVYKKGSLPRAVLAVVCGLFALYTFGAAYLYVIMRWVLDQSTTISGVISIGVIPFILPDLVKAGMGAIIGNEVVRRWKLLKEKEE